MVRTDAAIRCTRAIARRNRPGSVYRSRTACMPFLTKPSLWMGAANVAAPEPACLAAPRTNPMPPYARMAWLCDRARARSLPINTAR